MARLGNVLSLLIAVVAPAGCNGEGDALGSGGSGDTVYVRIQLRELPSTLTFNQAHVAMSHSEYAWGIRFDTDGDGRFETDIALMHFKFSDTPRDTSLIEGTQHDVWEEVDTLGGTHTYSRHRNVVVRIDPNAPTTIVIALPRAWPQIARIDARDRFYVHASYSDPTPPTSFDFTTITTGSALVTDAANDADYGFIDIISARWNRAP